MIYIWIQYFWYKIILFKRNVLIILIVQIYNYNVDIKLFFFPSIYRLYNNKKNYKNTSKILRRARPNRSCPNIKLQIYFLHNFFISSLAQRRFTITFISNELRYRVSGGICRHGNYHVHVQVPRKWTIL